MNLSVKNELSVDELLLLQSEMRNGSKSLALAYLMLLGGHLGVHRFYLKRFGSGATQLVLFLLASVSYVLGFVIGAALGWSEDAILAFFFVFTLTPGLILFVWVVVDIFLMPKMVNEWNRRLEETTIRQILDLRKND